MRIFFTTIVLFVLLMACTTTDDETQDTTPKKGVDLQKALQGTWQIYQINVAVNSADGLDSFRSAYLDQEIWEKDYKKQPPVYYFQVDQKYRLAHLSLGGEVLDESTGNWTIIGDTLVMVEPEMEYKYLVKLSNGQAGFRAFLDWDGDGKADDEYQSLLRKISIGTK